MGTVKVQYDQDANRTGAEDALVLVELESALEAVLAFLGHGPMCPYRHCGPCECIRAKVIDLLDEVKSLA